MRLYLKSCSVLFIMKTFKVCCRCKINKPVSNFSIHVHKITNRSTIRPNCRECTSIIQKEYREINREILRKRDAEYYQKNKEHSKNVQKNYLKNKENKEKRLKYLREYKAKRRKDDIQYRIKENLRKRVGKKLHCNKKYKFCELLGCTIDFYIKWIEFTMTKEMSWENYGSYWQIDHVMPIDYYDLTKEINQKKAFMWINTRAMKSSDNLQKKNKIVPKLILAHYEQVMDFEEKMDNLQPSY